MIFYGYYYENRVHSEYFHTQKRNQFRRKNLRRLENDLTGGNDVVRKKNTKIFKTVLLIILHGRYLQSLFKDSLRNRQRWLSLVHTYTHNFSSSCHLNLHTFAEFCKHKKHVV